MNSAPPLAAPVVRPRACSLQAVTSYSIVDDASAERRREAYDARRLIELKAEALDMLRDMLRDMRRRNAEMAKTLDEMRDQRRQIQAEMDALSETRS